MVSKFNLKSLKPRSLFELVSNRLQELEKENKQLREDNAKMAKVISKVRSDVQSMMVLYDIINKRG